MRSLFVFMTLFVSFSSWAIDDSMKQMPQIKPKRSYQVQTLKQGEQLVEQRGFGADEPQVRMMNLMMVGGSGLEGMDMQTEPTAAPTHSHQARASADQSIYEYMLKPTAVRVGRNLLTITVRERKTSSVAKGLKFKARVFMTSMDMGTEQPSVRETAPGQYQVQVNFSMQGPWAVQLIRETESKEFTFNVPTAARVQ